MTISFKISSILKKCTVGRSVIEMEENTFDIKLRKIRNYKQLFLLKISKASTIFCLGRYKAVPHVLCNGCHIPVWTTTSYRAVVGKVKLTTTKNTFKKVQHLACLGINGAKMTFSAGIEIDLTVLYLLVERWSKGAILRISRVNIGKHGYLNISYSWTLERK